MEPSSALRFPLVLGLALAAALSSCATMHGRTVEMDAVLVTVDEEDLALSRLNDEELFACGTTAYQAKDFPRAAKCFTRLADVFPKSRHAFHAQYNAGVAFESMGEYLLALERYRPVMDPDRGQGDALDATWRAASCHYHLGDFRASIELLARVAVRTDLQSVDRIHALTHIGVCHVELGELSAAEAKLREALAYWRERSEFERIEDYYPCQAQFFLAEIYRLHFETVKLEAVDDKDKLSSDLEYKAQLLLSAQGHYLRAIRMGNPHWAIAAGQRVGGLYEGLFHEMTMAPIPQTLDAEQAELYRQMLRKKVRVLIHKAIAIYERTLSAAERVGVASAFLDRTKESLDRMKQVLLADAAADDADLSRAVEEGASGEADPEKPADAEGELPPKLVPAPPLRG